MAVTHAKLHPFGAQIALVRNGFSLYTVILASHGPWWGGGSYGPRDLLDIMPRFVLLTILGLSSFLSDPQPNRQERSTVMVAACLFLFVSVAMNAVGAWSSSAAIDWNDHPPINSHPERVWDWEHPQFLAWGQK
jgi:hypothetical protein